MGLQAAANPQPGPVVPGSWAAAPVAPSHTYSRTCPRTSGCLSVKPGHRGCPCWQQGPGHLAARSHPAPCRKRLVGYIFHPDTGLWQGQAAPRQGSQRWSVPAWQPQAGSGCECEPRVLGVGGLKRRSPTRTSAQARESCPKKGKFIQVQRRRRWLRPGPRTRCPHGGLGRAGAPGGHAEGPSCLP